MRLNHFAVGPGALALILVLGLPATADPRAKLAPAGPCAEPREAVGAVAPSSFSVVGPLQALFSPADVAAAPASPGQGVPAAAGMIRPGPCDQPGAGCAQLANPVARQTAGGAANPIVPGARPSTGGVTPIGPGARPKPSHAGTPGGLPPGVRPAPLGPKGGRPGVRPKTRSDL